MPSSRSDDVRVIVDGVTFDGFYDADVDSDFETVADAFVVRGAPPSNPKLLSAFFEGNKVDVYVGDDRQMAGVIDDLHVRSNSSRDEIQIVGRDKGAYLVDNDAQTVGSLSGLTLEALANKLLLPSFGIRRVLLSNEANRKLLMGKKDRRSKAGTSKKRPLFSDAPRAETAVRPAQKIAQVLEERTRQLGVTFNITAEGDLFLGSPDYHQEVAFQFTCLGKDNPRRVYNNCEIELVRSMGDRASELTIVGQGSASSTAVFGGRATTAAGAKFKATARDEDLMARRIVRRRSRVDGDVLNRQQAQDRADYEAGLARMHGFTLRITTPDFRQGGRLFAVDTLANVRFEAAGVEGVFWVAQRRFIESRGKRRTELRLYPPGLWLP